MADSAYNDCLQLMMLYGKAPTVPDDDVPMGAGTGTMTAGETEDDLELPILIPFRDVASLEVDGSDWRDNQDGSAQLSERPFEDFNDASSLVARSLPANTDSGAGTDDQSSRAEAELERYRKESAASPEELDGRTPLLPGKPPNGRWWEVALHGY